MEAGRREKTEEIREQKVGGVCRLNGQPSVIRQDLGVWSIDAAKASNAINANSDSKND
jgi:hypothetical protein